MENLGKDPSTLNLTTGMPSSSSSSRFVQHEENCGHNMRDIDINQPAPETEVELPIGGMEEIVKQAAKLKKLRLFPEQTWLLEQAFNKNPTLESTKKVELATMLNILPRQVEVWHQNNKARTKAKRMEMENDCLKQQCQQLIEENMRLYRERERLQALMMPPPTSTTITMCPSTIFATPMPSASTTNLQLQPHPTKE